MISRRGVAALLGPVVLAASACSGTRGDRLDPAAEAAPAAASQSTAPGGADTAAAASEGTPAAATTTMPAEDAPLVVHMPWGAFVLADRIAERLAADHTLSLVLSSGPETDGSGEAMRLGWSWGAEEAQERHGLPIEARVVAADAGAGSATARVGGGDPVAVARAAEVASLVDSGAVDCLVVQGPVPAPLRAAVDDAVGAGLPVFTVDEDSPHSRRLAFHGLDDRAAGRLAGTLVGQWATDRGVWLRKAGVLTGDADDKRLISRMEGFVDGITAVLPHIEFVNGPAAGAGSPGAESPGFESPGAGSPGFELPGVGSPGAGSPGFELPGVGSPGAGSPGFELPGVGSPGFELPGVGSPSVELHGVESQGFEPDAVYGATAEWLVLHDDVSVVFHTDTGLERVSRLIADRLLYGRVFAAGFYSDERIDPYIRDEVVVAALLPSLAEQASAAAHACVDFLLEGALRTGHVPVEPRAVTGSNVGDRDWSSPAEPVTGP